ESDKSQLAHGAERARSSPGMPALGNNPLANPRVVGTQGVSNLGVGRADAGIGGTTEIAGGTGTASSSNTGLRFVFPDSPGPLALAQTPAKAQPPVAEAAPRKVIIRTGEMEFEVESFDAATTVISLLVNAIPGGFIATTNSEKLPNGKVRGAVV